MNDLNAKYLTFKQAAQTLPGRPHISTLARWRSRGIHGVKLTTVKIGGRRMVAADDLQRFIEAVTCAADGQPAPTRTSKQRQRAVERAEAELRREGVGEVQSAREKPTSRQRGTNKGTK